MPIRERSPQPVRARVPRMRPVGTPVPYPAEKARGAEIILREPWQRAVFFGGLAAMLAFALAMSFVRV